MLLYLIYELIDFAIDFFLFQYCQKTWSCSCISKWTVNTVWDSNNDYISIKDIFQNFFKIRIQQMQIIFLAHLELNIS